MNYLRHDGLKYSLFVGEMVVKWNDSPTLAWWNGSIWTDADGKLLPVERSVNVDGWEFRLPSLEKSRQLAEALRLVES